MRAGICPRDAFLKKIQLARCGPDGGIIRRRLNILWKGVVFMLLMTKKPRIIKVLLFITALLLAALPLAPAAASMNTQELEGGTVIYLPVLFKAPEPATLQSMSVGPFGGTLTALVVDPGNPSVVYAGAFGAGVFRSADQGLSWTQRINGLNNTYIQSLAVDPHNGNILYAGTYAEGIYKSTNAGASWFASNGGLTDGIVVYDLEVDPQNPTTVYFVGRIKDTLIGVVYKSVNGGADWNLLLRGDHFNTDDYFYDIDVDPGNSSVLYLSAHEHGFYKSVDGGASFSAINSGVSDRSARSTAIDSGNPVLLFGGVWHGEGVYRSANGGANWTAVSSGLPAGVKVYRVYLDQSAAGTKPLFACTYENGLYRSTNNGSSWTSAGLSGQFLYDFAIAPGSPQNWYAGLSFRGLYRSTNQGANWNPSHNGLSSLSINGFASLASQPGYVYAGVYGIGVVRSNNGGNTWQEVNTGLGSRLVTRLTSADNTLYALTPNAVYVSTGSSWTTLNNPQSEGYDPTWYVETVMEGISQPEDYTPQELLAQWENQPKAGLTNTPLISLTALGGTLYGGTAGAGLWKYSNGSWSQVGLNGYQVRSLSADTLLGRVLLTACDTSGNCTARYLKNGAFTSINQGLEGVNINQILVRGDDYFAATTSGIYIRDNTGTLWIRAGAAGANVLSITFHPQNSALMAAGGFGATFWSGNSGASWQIAAPVLTRWNYQSVMIDPANSQRVYFGAREAGAYRWDRQ